MKLNKLNSSYFFNLIRIKTLIFILIFCLLSTKIFGAVDDVYYCEMVNLIEVKNDKQDSYQPQKFKFKRLKNKLQFGSEQNYFKDFSLPITFSSGELFSAGDNMMANFSYDDGKFYYAASTYEKAIAINGNCSIF